jgi:hypothetical protein
MPSLPPILRPSLLPLLAAFSSFANNQDGIVLPLRCLAATTLIQLSDAKRSAVEPQHYFTYRELQPRILYYSYIKKHRSCWELVGSLLVTCSKIPVWEILNCDRTCSILLLGGFQCQNNDGEALVLTCSSPVLGCVQPELAGGDTYKKTAYVMTSPGVMGRS